eukprot:gene14189-18114_t
MKYEDMIILAPTVRKTTRSKSPLAVLVKMFTDEGILVHITDTEN